MRRLIGWLVIVAAVVSGCQADAGERSAGPGQPPAKVRVGVIPNIAPDRQRARYEPFQAYLARTLGVDVELFVATDYAGVVSALAADKLDVAYLGGLTYVQAEQQVELTPLVTEIDRETGTREYLSAVVVRHDAPYRSVEDLLDARASFAFGDVSSTSGSLYPHVMLAEAGARCSAEDPGSCPPLSKTTFTGGHDATAQAVLGGSVDAGGLELRILHRLERDGSVPKGALRVIATRKVMGYPWVVRQPLGDGTRAALVRAFTSISDRDLLDLLRAERYAPVTAGDYQEVRQQAARFGLVTTG
ncbi:MAG TPA: phosphate/phosphite/phosphonate ABC transporter substrate-binding protein [Actinomycetes bacterium]|jgi:phosphonate transport system substrate-binding protein|nr:phosphate/phosphite/phosphonate ABC transporter substrate-binding protein [Actinomycetes bacterium]